MSIKRTERQNGPGNYLETWKRPSGEVLRVELWQPPDICLTFSGLFRM